jgi:hypothetical protein
MEFGSVPACSIYFTATIDKFVRFEPAPFEDMESLLVAEEAVVDTKSFDSAKGVSLGYGKRLGFEVIWEMGLESLWPSGQSVEHRSHGGLSQPAFWFLTS